MSFKFWKMHGIGNDFVVLTDGLSSRSKLSPKQGSRVAKILCDRRLGVGADQLLWLRKPSKKTGNPDFEFLIWNQDGSRAKMCGNGIRCAAHLLKKLKISQKKTIRWQTLGGIVTTKIEKFSGAEAKVWVQMGNYRFNPNQKLKLNNGKQVLGGTVDVGNPHFVCDEFLEKNQREYGPLIEKHENFSQGVNVEFVKKINPNKLKVIVWERGSGFTQACGTGACAAAVYAVETGLMKKSKFTVNLPGGDLKLIVNRDQNEVDHIGPSQLVFEGQFII